MNLSQSYHFSSSNQFGIYKKTISDQIKYIKHGFINSGPDKKISRKKS